MSDDAQPITPLELAEDRLGLRRGAISEFGPPTDDALARVAFAAYNAEGPNPNRTWDGKDVPPFDVTGPQVQGRWRAAARALRIALIGCLLLAPGLALAQGASPPVMPWWLQLVTLFGGSGVVASVVVWLARRGLASAEAAADASPWMQYHPGLLQLTHETGRYLDGVVVGLEQTLRPMLAGPLDTAGRAQMQAAALQEFRRAAVGGLPILSHALQLGEAWLVTQVGAAVARMNASRDTSTAQAVMAAPTIVTQRDLGHVSVAAQRLLAAMTTEQIEAALVAVKPFQAKP